MLASVVGAGCGGGSDTGTDADTGAAEQTTTTVKKTPQQRTEAVFAGAAGYTLEPVSAEQQAEMKKDLADDPELAAAISHFEMRIVKQGAAPEPIGAIFVVVLSDSATSAQKDEALAEITKDAKTRETRAYGGQNATFFLDSDDVPGIVWTEGELLVMMAGTDEAQVTALANVVLPAAAKA